MFPLFQSCKKKQDDSVWWSQEQEKAKLTAQLDLLHFRQNQSTAPHENERRIMDEEIKRLETRRQILLEKHASLMTEVADLKYKLSSIPSIEELNKNRANSVGKRIKTLSLANGRTFQNVTVVRIEDGGVSIRHDHGAATLRFADLSPNQQIEFGMERDSALEAEKNDLSRQTAYERWISNEMQAMELRNNKVALMEQLEKNRNANFSSSLYRRTDGSGYSTPLSRPPTPVGTRSCWPHYWRNSFYYRRYGTRSTYYYPYSNYFYQSP